MNIREYRNKEHLSQAEFASKYGIRLRTLQDWEQGRYDPPEYLLNLLGKSHLVHETLPPIKIKDVFKVCICNPFQNANRVYPIQQKSVQLVLDDVKANPHIIKVIVFGSSVTNYCHMDSDLDIFFEMDEDTKPLNRIFDFEIDAWTNYSVDEHLLEEIKNKGVIVYERNIS